MHSAPEGFSMPVVDVHYKKRRVPRKVLNHLAATLPTMVADHFTCNGGGMLTTRDVEVRFHKRNRRDVARYPVSIDVNMTAYTERSADLDSRSDRLFKAIQRIIGPQVGFGLWVNLAFRSWWIETGD